VIAYSYTGWFAKHVHPMFSSIMNLFKFWFLEFLNIRSNNTILEQCPVMMQTSVSYLVDNLFFQIMVPIIIKNVWTSSFSVIKMSIPTKIIVKNYQIYLLLDLYSNYDYIILGQFLQIINHYTIFLSP